MLTTTSTTHYTHNLPESQVCCFLVCFLPRRCWRDYASINVCRVHPAVVYAWVALIWSPDLVCWCRTHVEITVRLPCLSYLMHASPHVMALIYQSESTVFQGSCRFTPATVGGLVLFCSNIPTWLSRLPSVGTPTPSTSSQADWLTESCAGLRCPLKHNELNVPSL